MSEYREIIIIPAAMFQKVFRLSQSYHGKISGLKGNGGISLRFYAQASGSNSIAAQQRKKILTYQTTNLADAEGVSGGAAGSNAGGVAGGNDHETIIHPAFVTSSNLTSYLGKPVKPVVSVTQCETYNLDKVRSDLSLRGIAPIQIVPNECIMFKYKQQDVFVFKFGTIVAWNIEEKEIISAVVPLFKNAEVHTYSYQSEDLDYVELSPKGTEKDDNSYVSPETEIICLSTVSPQQKLLDMLAFSYGISRSTRLAILEEAVETHIRLSRLTIDRLSEGKKIAVDPQDALKLSGRLLLLRGKLNLYSELVETPDIYWSESRLEKIHENISNALDISKRIVILNRKLDYLSDEAEALIAIMSKRTEVNLELIIIYLIVIEVCFEVYHFYDRLGGKYNIEYFRALLQDASSSSN